MSIPQQQGPVTESTSEDLFATLRKRRRGVRVTAAAAVALGLAISGGSVAAATAPSSGRQTEIREVSEAGNRAIAVGSDATAVVSSAPTGSEVPA